MLKKAIRKSPRKLRKRRNRQNEKRRINNFQLEYRIDYNWHIGRLKEVPGVFSQRETLEELEENIKDAHRLMLEDVPSIPLSNP